MSGNGYIHDNILKIAPSSLYIVTCYNNDRYGETHIVEVEHHTSSLSFKPFQGSRTNLQNIKIKCVVD